MEEYVIDFENYKDIFKIQIILKMRTIMCKSLKDRQNTVQFISNQISEINSGDEQ